MGLAHLLADLRGVVYLDEGELSQPGNMAEWRVKFSVWAVVTCDTVAKILVASREAQQD
jgi:hypothetical protein